MRNIEMKSTDKFVLVLVASLALLLAGCGGGSSSMEEPTEPPAVDPAVAERAAINTAIMAARAAVPGVDNDSTDSEVSAAETAIANARAAIAAATNVPAEEKAANTATVDTLEAQLNGAKMARSDAMDAAAKAAAEAMAKVGKALRAALGGPTAGGNALANIDTATTPVSLGASGLVIDAAAGAGALTTDPDSVTLKAGNSAGSLNGWAGTDYALTTGTGASKLTNEARVYTNRGSPTSMTFVEKYGDATEYTASSRTYNVGATADSNIKASAFPTAGEQTFTGAQDIQGTYDGASGRYKCAAGDTCTATFTTTGIQLSDAWTFVHDSGARVSTPDANYLYYGWWVSKDKDGGPTAASAFTGTVGTVAVSVDVTTISGSAKYAGRAAGKFAMSNPLDGTGNGGHFTADAELTAKFGANAAPNNGGISGTIDNFRLNDGAENPGWSVTLNRAQWGTTGAFTSTADTTNTTAEGTVWSINGNSASESGAWMGQMYDEMPGNAPSGDGSNIPTTVTGTFYSEFSTIGRMVGAFGADKE
ncbi:MAG: hypothetical protein F4Z52_03540 [Gammaproteobacteria bacterium]|nr:hypothetical protein [Gammaproteobacteria bacterium]